MALKPCRECGREVARSARTCPHCGKRNPGGPTPGALGCLGCFGLLAVVLVVGTFADILDQAEDLSTGLSRGWEVVGSQGTGRFVYMRPDVLGDTAAVARALGEIVPETGAVQVDIFDALEHTPTRLPMTDAQMLHWRAQYVRNPTTGLEEFTFLTVADSTASPPTHDVVEAPIRPVR